MWGLYFVFSSIAIIFGMDIPVVKYKMLARILESKDPHYKLLSYDVKRDYGRGILRSVAEMVRGGLEVVVCDAVLLDYYHEVTQVHLVSDKDIEKEFLGWIRTGFTGPITISKVASKGSSIQVKFYSQTDTVNGKYFKLLLNQGALLTIGCQPPDSGDVISLTDLNNVGQIGSIMRKAYKATLYPEEFHASKSPCTLFVHKCSGEKDFCTSLNVSLKQGVDYSTNYWTLVKSFALQLYAFPSIIRIAITVTEGKLYHLAIYSSAQFLEASNETRLLLNVLKECFGSVSYFEAVKSEGPFAIFQAYLVERSKWRLQHFRNRSETPFFISKEFSNLNGFQDVLIPNLGQKFQSIEVFRSIDNVFNGTTYLTFYTFERINVRTEFMRLIQCLLFESSKITQWSDFLSRVRLERRGNASRIYLCFRYVPEQRCDCIGLMFKPMVYEALNAISEGNDYIPYSGTVPSVNVSDPYEALNIVMDKLEQQSTATPKKKRRRNKDVPKVVEAPLAATKEIVPVLESELGEAAMDATKKIVSVPEAKVDVPATDHQSPAQSSIENWLRSFDEDEFEAILVDFVKTLNN